MSTTTTNVIGWSGYLDATLSTGRTTMTRLPSIDHSEFCFSKPNHNFQLFEYGRLLESIWRTACGVRLCRRIDTQRIRLNTRLCHAHAYTVRNYSRIKRSYCVPVPEGYGEKRRRLRSTCEGQRWGRQRSTRSSE